MALKVNRKAVSAAKALIADGKVATGDWSFSGEDGNKLLGKDGKDWKAYAAVHLAEDSAEPQETKGRYKYPCMKDGKVWRKGVIAAKSRAAGQGEDAVENAAAGLLDLIDKDNDDAADAQVEPAGKENQLPQPGTGTSGTLSDCAGCGGSGKFDGKDCPKCGGTGKVDSKSPHAVQPQTGALSTQATLEQQQGAEVGSSRKPPQQGGVDSADSSKFIRGAMRVDRALAPDWMSTPFEKTPEGFLKGRAIVTGTGVFPYMDATGKVQRELRLPQDVFHPDHLDSLKLKPITNDHPTELVTPENIGKYQVGHLGANPDYTDNYHLAYDMIITNKDAIAAVEAGKRQLSCRYTCDLEKADEGATHMGVGYDYIQHNIRANHVAIVDKGRAGDSARIRLDSAEMVLIEEGDSNMKKIKLDGAIEFDVPEPVVEAFAKLQARVDAADATLKTTKDTADKALSAEKARADAAEASLKQAKDPATIQAAVDAAIRLDNGAYLAEVKRTDTMTNIDVMKAVILKSDPTAKLDGKDAVYIQARFDAAVSSLEAQAGAIGSIVRQGGPSPHGAEHEDVSGQPFDPNRQYDSAAAHERMRARMRADSRAPTGTRKDNIKEAVAEALAAIR